MIPPFDPRVYMKLMFYSIVFLLVCTYLFAEDVRIIKGEKFEQDGHWCFVEVSYYLQDDVMTKKERLVCSEDPEGLQNDKVKELYNDTMDYKKYKINLKRTEMTSQY